MSNPVTFLSSSMTLPSVDYTKSFLEWAWSGRKSMNEVVAIGFRINATCYFHTCIEELVRSFLQTKDPTIDFGRKGMHDLQSVHKSYASETIGAQIKPHGAILDSLTAFRNLVGHGNKFQIDFDEKLCSTRLKSILKVHNEAEMSSTVPVANLVVQNARAQADAIDCILTEEFMLYYLNIAKEITKLYCQANSLGNPHSLPNLT